MAFCKNAIYKNVICKKSACYGFIYDNFPSFCKTHKEDGMVNIVSKRCKKAGCEKIPSFGYQGESASYCKTHMKDGMINVNTRLCKEDGCKIQANFGHKGKAPLYCKTHMEDGMINVVNRKCEEEGCEKIPSFAYQGEKASYCKSHIKNGMVNVVSKRCQEEGCEKITPYGYCVVHKKVKVPSSSSSSVPKLCYNQICNHANCNTIACFGFKDDKYPSFCKSHIEVGMVDIRNRKCQKCNILRIHPKYLKYCSQCYKTQNKSIEPVSVEVVHAEPVVEVEPIVEDEPIVEAEPVIEDEPVVEAEPVIEDEPVVEAPKRKKARVFYIEE